MTSEVLAFELTHSTGVEGYISQIGARFRENGLNPADYVFGRGRSGDFVSVGRGDTVPIPRDATVVSYEALGILHHTRAFDGGGVVEAYPAHHFEEKGVGGFFTPTPETYRVPISAIMFVERRRPGSR